MNIHFVFGSYNPTSALGNRCLAYMRALSELSVKATFYFLLPDKSKSKVDHLFPSITIVYMWEWWHINNKLLKYIPYSISIFRLKRLLKAGDRVYMYDLNDVPQFLFNKKGIKLFYEKTEHPLVSNYGSLLRRVTLKSHLEDCRKFDGIFVISNALRDYYISQGINSKKIQVINIIVDSKRFIGLKQESRGRYIVYCGNANNNKDGVDWLIKSFSVIHDSFPDVKLMIIGPKPDESKNENNLVLTRQLGIESSVIFEGIVAPHLIPQYLSNAVVAALDRPMSIQAEYGFPTKLGEYLLSGKPVVVTKVGDIPQFLEDKVSAIIAEPNSVSSFANCLSWVLSHPEEATCIGERGRKVAELSFNYLEETKKLIEFMCS